jgi:hypothetical protein
MPCIEAHGWAVFTLGNGKLIECSATLAPGPGAGNGCPCAALRLPCALVLANKEAICL